MSISSSCRRGMRPPHPTEQRCCRPGSAVVDLTSCLSRSTSRSPGARCGSRSWHGTGVPVLAIHGITSTSRTWPFLADALDHAVFAPDLRGRGRSNRLPGPVGLVQHAEDCAEVVAATGGVPVGGGRSLHGRFRRHRSRGPPPGPGARAGPGGRGSAVPARRRGGDPRRPAADQGATPGDVHPGGATATGSASTPPSPATGRRKWRRTPTTTCPSHPAVRPPIPRWSRPTRSTWSRDGVPRGAGEADAAADLPARLSRLRRRPPGLYPQAHRRRVRRALARPRRPPRAGRQPLHDRAQSPRCRRDRERGPRPRRTDRDPQAGA